MEKLIEIGYTQKPHGLNGEIKVVVEEIYEDDFYEAKIVFLDIKGKQLPYFLDSVRGGNALIVKFEEVKSKDEAMMIGGKKMFLREADVSVEALEAVDLEFKYLEGYTIYDVEWGEIAVINEVIEMPQQEMAMIRYKNRDVLVPLNEFLIVQIDDDAKIVAMDLPDGLLEM